MISLRGLTGHTIKSYSTYITAYLEYLDIILKKKPEDVSWQEMREFICYIKQLRNLSDRTINACISQLRFFTLYVLHKPWDQYQLPMRKFDSYMPFVPTQEEARHFIDTLPDLKQKAMFSLIYSAGLRVGEVTNLNYRDIDRKNMRIYIAKGKNRCDRFAILSVKALEILTEYWFKCGEPRELLFPQQRGALKPLSSQFLSECIRAHEKRLGWNRRLKSHSFRHAFGTHLYENGTDLLTIKGLLGHKSLHSTTIYVSLAANGTGQAVSPFDSWKEVGDGI
jgi:site-specific recombinase XerD